MKKEKEFLTDDCGNHFLDVPDWVFTEACRRHDFGYWLGNTKQDRARVDWRFYLDMLDSIGEQPWYRRWYLTAVARTYYYAVRLFSGKFFYYGPFKRTRNDLIREMRNAGIH